MRGLLSELALGRPCPVRRRFAHSTPGRGAEPATSNPQPTDIGEPKVETMNELEYEAARKRGDLAEDKRPALDQEACASGSKVGGARGVACERQTRDWDVHAMKEFDKSEKDKKNVVPPATNTKQTPPEGQSDG